MTIARLDLLGHRDHIQLHNQTTVIDPGQEFITDPSQWSNAISVPIEIPPAPSPGLDPCVEVVVATIDGGVGVGVMDHDLRNFISSEMDARATGRAVRIELQPIVTDARAHLLVRNTASGGIRSRFRLVAASLSFKAKDRRLLVPTPCPEIPMHVSAQPGVSGTFDVLISHSSRVWDATQCDRGYLQGRYAKPGRLDDPPPFLSLSSNAAPYHGLLSVARLHLSPDGLSSQLLHHFASTEKVVHAAVAGDRLVVCCDAGVAVFPHAVVGNQLWVDPATDERITDPWFGGLHTVIPVDDKTCLVSSSGADAILWLDLSRKAVTRRWRLPDSRYGVNYALDESMSLTEHYIPNDLQLGHLNCAAPDGRGGVFWSVLGQGDIGHVSPSGEWTVLTSGYVGCHGVRYNAHDDSVYFCDSCSGRLMRIDRQRRLTMLFDAESRWLHDAVHLTEGLFLLTLGDQNRLVLADTGSGRRVAYWDFSEVVGSIQFLSVMG